MWLAVDRVEMAWLPNRAPMKFFFFGVILGAAAILCAPEWIAARGQEAS